MTDKQFMEMTDILHRELEVVLHEVFGKEYLCRHVKNDSSITMYSEDFLISFDYESKLNSISFLVGLSGQEVAKYMTCILSVFEPNELQFLSDSYFDKVANELVFGQEALSAKQRDVLESFGKTKCAMCDFVYPSEQVEDNVCVRCKRSYDKFKWH